MKTARWAAVVAADVVVGRTVVVAAVAATKSACRWNR
jgi:hypothetical protein